MNLCEGEVLLYKWKLGNTDLVKRKKDLLKQRSFLMKYFNCNTLKFLKPNYIFEKNNKVEQ